MSEELSPVTEEASKEPRPVSELTFKEASQELGQIVNALDGGELELEDALQKYSRGTELLESLRERLNEAENTVNKLVDAPASQDN